MNHYQNEVDDNDQTEGLRTIQLVGGFSNMTTIVRLIMAITMMRNGDEAITPSGLFST